MEITIYISSFIIGVVLGGAVVFFFRRMAVNRLIRAAERKAARMLAEARTEAKEISDKAREDAEKAKAATEAEHRERRTELQRQENRLQSKTENLDRKQEGLNQRERNLANREKSLETTRAQLEEAKNKQVKQLELISGMSSAEAKNALLERMESEMQEEAARRLHEWETRLKVDSDRKAQEILAQVIQRSASEIVSETTVVSVPLPSDEMKGRLIGREGRNIRALEQATGVDLIVDDTPEAVTLSSFDPIRREVARNALTRLILDGRIHPARIEEVVQKAEEEIEADIQTAGEQASYEVGVHGLRPELIRLLGRLKYRTSFGQNVLQHSMEVGRLAGMMASELGLDSQIAMRCGLLHDIGKALDHDQEGSHALIGAEEARRWGEDEQVVNAIEAHHEDVDAASLYAGLIIAADTMSASRPGARRETLERYIKRLERLENLARRQDGVQQAYAIQAGREIRVLVDSERVNDKTAAKLSRDIARDIERELQYPGEVQVTVIRESRFNEVAH